MLNANLLKYAALPVIAVGVLVVVSLFRGGAVAEAANNDTVTWEIGQLIAIPSPDNPLVPNRLTVLNTTAWGEITVVDQDGDVFECLGAVSAAACRSTGMVCPKGAAWAARTPGIRGNALWMCSQTPVPVTRTNPPAGWTPIPTCNSGERLWVDMVGGRIVSYRCAQ